MTDKNNHLDKENVDVNIVTITEENIKETNQENTSNQSLITWASSFIGSYVGDFCDDYSFNNSKGAEVGAKVGAEIGDKISNVLDATGAIDEFTNNTCGEVGRVIGDFLDDGVINNSSGAKVGKTIGDMVGSSLGKKLNNSGENKGSAKSSPKP